MIVAEIKRHPLEFSLLGLILICGTAAFFYFGYDQHDQRRVVYVTGAAYFLWSLFHHYRKGDLEVSLIVEYLAISLFAVILLASTLV